MAGSRTSQATGQWHGATGRRQRPRTSTSRTFSETPIAPRTQAHACCRRKPSRLRRPRAAPPRRPRATRARPPALRLGQDTAGAGPRDDRHTSANHPQLLPDRVHSSRALGSPAPTRCVGCA
eukprot:scaffold55038_cov66-Phaeocystis_antarctica.AAC.1